MNILFHSLPMTTFIPISTYLSSIHPSQDKFKTHKCFRTISSKPNNFHSCSRLEIGSLHQKGFASRVFGDKWSSFELGEDKDEILFSGLNRKNNNKRVVLVRLNKGGLGFNGGGGGGGDNGRILGNLALAVGLTYLSLTGQLGWLLDAIVSVWLLAVIIPIVGLGALFWWAGRDIVQSSEFIASTMYFGPLVCIAETPVLPSIFQCPNCGNEFQIFRSVVNENSQQCPYCSQPFTVVGNEFVRDPDKFSSEANTFGEAFNDFFPRSKKEKKNSKTIVDVEAKVKDVE